MASYARISPWESTVSAVHTSFVEPYSPLTSPWRDALEKFLACDEFLWKSFSSKTFCGKWFVEHYDFLARNCWEMTNARTHVDTLFFFIFFCVLCEVGFSSRKMRRFTFSCHRFDWQIYHGRVHGALWFYWFSVCKELPLGFLPDSFWNGHNETACAPNESITRATIEWHVFFQKL